MKSHTEHERSRVSGDTIIEVKNVNVSFPTKSGEVDVLKDVNFEIKSGSFTILFGPSGSGKTTLLNVMNGLEQPTSGQVNVADQDIYSLTPDQRAYMRATTMGIVHQSNYWVKSLTVLENVALPLYLAGSPKDAALLVARESLDKVDMAWTANLVPTSLSGGEQQRISMARAVAATPSIIFADEPTGNLDSTNGKMIMDLLTYFQRDFGRTVVLVTHNIEYLPLGTSYLFVKDGKVLASHDRKMPDDILHSLKTQVDALTKMREAK